MWTEQCDATTGIRNAFGAQQALNYLIGEKLLDYIEAAEKDENFERDLPAFTDRIRSLFTAAELAAYLAPIDETSVTREPGIVRCASDPGLVQSAWRLIRK